MQLYSISNMSWTRPLCRATFNRAPSNRWSLMTMRQATTTTHASSIGNAYGANRQEAIKWFAKTTLGCTMAGLALSLTMLNDHNLAPVYEKMEDMRKGLKAIAKEYGMSARIPLVPEAHAFSLPDHGLHPPHYPWEHHKLWVSYDHAA